ncbi:MAG TPA: hypothetical protein VMT76_18495 [Puia sp.]|nr:hypothetical protein [Puia sp.]
MKFSNKLVENRHDIFFVSEHSYSEFYHGGIGNVDIEKILLKEGFTPISFPYHFSFSIRAKCARLIFLIKLLLSLRKGSVVIAQFPLYAKMNKLLLCLISKRKSISVIYIIADINGLKDGNDLLLSEELKEMGRCSYFILHNENMHLWLKKHIFSAKCSLLYFFDFPAPVSTSIKTKTSTVAFAGNLSKSLFLEKLDKINSQNLQFLLYGPGVTETMKSQKNVYYKGVFPPYKLPQKIEGSFGLVWDGNCVDEPCGSIGYYMHFITHHKVSLYILSGMPIIIYANAGSAALITQYKIGFTINSLDEIEQKISSVTEKEYQDMIINTKFLAKKIASGSFLREAINRIFEQININNSEYRKLN